MTTEPSDIEIIPGVRVGRKDEGDDQDAWVSVNMIELNAYVRHWCTSQPRVRKHDEKIEEGFGEWLREHPDGQPKRGMIAYVAAHAGCDSSIVSRYLKREPSSIGISYFQRF